MSPAFRATILSVALSMLLAGAAAQQFPHLQEENLNGQTVVLPEGVSGKVAVLVLGFSHASSTPTGAWAKRAQSDFSKDPGFALYQLAVIEAAPSFIRGMITSGMKKGLSDSQRASIVPVVHQEDALKTLVAFKQPDDAYIVLLDRSGHVVYQTHGSTADPGYAELRVKVQALLK
jgi:hypothetical protein